MKPIEVNILIAGVGGQGNILASRILSRAAIKEGLKAVVGETFGASQRGGPVLSHVKIGLEVFSPLITKAQGHVLLGLEPIEALRVALYFLSPSGLAIVNTKPVPSVGVKSGLEKYPELNEIVKLLKEVTGEVIKIDATTIAEKAGNSLVTNVVMIGALMGTRKLPVSIATIEETIKESVPKRTIDMNIEAFKSGLNAILARAPSDFE